MGDAEAPGEAPSTHQGRVRIIVASDLHAYEGTVDPPPSRLKLGHEDPNPSLDPISGFERLVKDEEISANILLCPGDLGDGAQTGGVTHGWKMLQRMADALEERPDVVASTGNHDVKSRPETPQPAEDPVETLRNLTPRYPFEHRPVQQAYFGDHYAIVGLDGCRVLTVNTAAHHTRGDPEYNFGRVSPRTRQRMMVDLAEDGYSPLNVLLCHHHPIEYTSLDEPDRSSIIGGSLLINELASVDLGPWVVVHGHKHIPHLSYAPGGGGSPVLFSAGSLSASFHLDQQPATRNQVYWLEFDPDAATALHARVLCRFRSWYWVPNRGWLRTTPGSGLPAEGGFGCRTDPCTMAYTIREELLSSGKPFLGWDDLLATCPEVEFLMPADLEAVSKELERLDCGVTVNDSGRYEEVARRWPIDAA